MVTLSNVAVAVHPGYPDGAYDRERVALFVVGKVRDHVAGVGIGLPFLEGHGAAGREGSKGALCHSCGPI